MEPEAGTEMDAFEDDDDLWEEPTVVGDIGEVEEMNPDSEAGQLETGGNVNVDELFRF